MEFTINTKLIWLRNSYSKMMLDQKKLQIGIMYKLSKKIISNLINNHQNKNKKRRKN